MTELALDDLQRHTFAGELERMRMAQLMRREPVLDARLGWQVPVLAADGGA